MKKPIELTVVLYCLWIAIFKFFLLPQIIHQFIKIASITYILLFIIKNVKVKSKGTYLVLLLGLSTFISSIHGYVNGLISISNLIDSILNMVCIYCMYIITSYTINNKKFNLLLDSLFRILLVYNIINIVSVFIIGVNSVSLMTYFLGNKFRTSYYLILLLCIWYFRKKEKNEQINKLLLVMSIVFCSIFCKYVECTTAFVASLLLILLIFNNKKIISILTNHKIITLAVFLSGAILLVLTQIINHPKISYILVNVLNENTGLTGRFVIYEHLQSVFLQSPILGHGYGNYSVGEAVGFGNAQNSVLQYLIDYGIIGFIIFIIVIFLFTKVKDEKKLDKIWPLFVYIYIMIICATIEIVFNHIFFLVIFIIFNYGKGIKEEEKI